MTEAASHVHVSQCFSKGAAGDDDDDDDEDEA
jgi:hypothetical protein